MTTWDPDDKERTALHEAGHAVVAWSCGVVIGSIHLDTVKEGGRATTTTPILTFAENHTPFEQIAFYVAGYEAEEIFKPPGRMFNQLEDWGK